MGNIASGILFGGLLILAGLLAWKFPNLISFYSLLSKAERKNIDLKAAGKASCIVLVASGIAGALLNWVFCTAGWAGAELAMIAPLVIGVLLLFFLSRKYDSNPASSKRYRANAFTLSVITLAAVLCLICWARPTGVELGKNSITFTGIYGMELPFENIRSVSLEERLPAIEARVNGIGMGNIQKGNYRLSGIGKCKLHVNLEHPPFLRILTNDGEQIFYNAKEREMTPSLYDTLSLALKSPERH